jgi:hypothetical protein
MSWSASALLLAFADARLANCAHGFPIERVLATGHESTGAPTDDQRAGAAGLVDDYLPYMRGVSSNVCTRRW